MCRPERTAGVPASARAHLPSLCHLLNPRCRDLADGFGSGDQPTPSLYLGFPPAIMWLAFNHWVWLTPISALSRPGPRSGEPRGHMPPDYLLFVSASFG
jgi:hypothetical protein